MKNIKPPVQGETYIAFLGPRHDVDFEQIMYYVIKILEEVHQSYPDTKNFIFINDGIGSSNQLRGIINILQNLMVSWGKYATSRKLDVDVELHGPQAQYRWVDQVIDLEPVMMVVLDNNHQQVLRYAVEQAEAAGIETRVRRVPFVEPKNRVN